MLRPSLHTLCAPRSLEFRVPVSSSSDIIEMYALPTLICRFISQLASFVESDKLKLPGNWKCLGTGQGSFEGDEQRQRTQVAPLTPECASSRCDTVTKLNKQIWERTGDTEETHTSMPLKQEMNVHDTKELEQPVLHTKYS